MYYDVTKRIESLRKIKSKLYQHEFLSKNGTKEKVLALRCEKAEDIDPMIPGYILTHDGELLPVVEGDVHPKVAENYLKKYFGDLWIDQKRQGKSYMDLINEISAGIYFGPRFNSDSGQIENREVMFLVKKAPFLLEEKQIEKLMLLEESILLNNLSLKYCGPGMTTFSHLIEKKKKKVTK